jgi:hypothetical protein
MSMGNTNNSYFLPELASPGKFTLTPLSKYHSKASSINPYGSPHISHITNGPVIGKSKHYVDYYKHMK